MRSIVVTSPLSGDGKTTTSCNLAIASTGLDRSRSVALIELDLRRPSLARCLGLDVKQGIEDVLEGNALLDEAILETNVPGLSILAVRKGRLAPEQLLSSENLRKLIRSLEERFSLLIIDTPPILMVSDALSVADVADGCLLVARAGRSATAGVRSAVEQLPAEKMLGCSLNFSRDSRPAGNYDAYPNAYVQDLRLEESE
jgi:capsular exopolysaccharide synthesis family protein